MQAYHFLLSLIRDIYYTEDFSIYGTLSKLLNTFERVSANLPKLSEHFINLSLFLEKKQRKEYKIPKNSQWSKGKK